MTILVFGHTGQVAQELVRLSNEVTFSFIFLGRNEVDLSHPDKCAEAIITHKPIAVINAAAWTDVDAAETHEPEALIINGEAPFAMSSACAKLSIPFLHISSDYVFDGSGDSPWRPHDSVGPLSAYGRSKLLGERLIQDSGARAIIMRTSWVFSAHGSNFVKTMLRLGIERDILNIVGDQLGGPTSARSIARTALELIKALLEGSAGGIFHYSGTPNVSWAQFAKAIMDQAGLSCDIKSILTKEYPTLAHRPLNSRMDCGSILDTFGITQPAWVLDLEQVINELKEQSDAT